MSRFSVILVILLVIVTTVKAKKDRSVLTSIGDFFTDTYEKAKNYLFPDTHSTINILAGVTQSCVAEKNESWWDKELGDFTVDKDSPYCDVNCSRSAVCCAPQKPQDINVQFLFFDERNQSYPLRLNDERSENQLRNSRKLIWFSHGFKDNIFKNPVFNQTKDAFLRRGYNVVLIDWSKANKEYFQALANIRIVGALTAQMIARHNVVDISTCVGFSLGSHVCGEVGKWLRKNGTPIPKCTGIDPAGPGFDGCSTEIRLDVDDCDLVTSLHTSQFEDLGSLISNEGLGTKRHTGHCKSFVRIDLIS